MTGNQGARTATLWFGVLAVALGLAGCAPASVPILAADVPIHLGDQTDLGSPWKPISGFAPVATGYQADFYLDATGGRWILVLEALQPNDRGNRVLINGRELDPPYLPGRDWDFASYYVTYRLRVPPGVLRAGRNTFEARVGQWVPRFQVATNRWEDIQIRNVRLISADTR